MYFLDDSYMQANSVLSDIDNFVNGFKVEKLELKQWSGNLSHPQLNATPIPRKLYHYRYIHWGAMTAFFFISCLVLYSGVLLLVSLEKVIEAFLLLSTACLMVWYQKNPARKKIKQEKERLQTGFLQLSTQLQKLITEYNNPPDVIVYSNGLRKLEQLVHEVRRLPDEYTKKQKLMDERLYNEQLHDYLRIFDIQSHEIPTFGAGKKTLLLNAGIRNAADISLLNRTRVSGIGPKNQQVLMSWQRQMASGFTYIPDAHKLAIGMQQVNQDIAGLKLVLESQIRKEYQSLNYMKLNITNRAMVLENQINDIALKTSQAQVDVLAFEKFCRFM